MTGTLPGFIFGVSNDAGKTAIRWSHSVFDCIEYLKPHQETLSDYAVVVVADKSAAPSGCRQLVADVIAIVNSLPTKLSDEQAVEHREELLRAFELVDKQIYDKKSRYLNSREYRIKQDAKRHREQTRKQSKSKAIAAWARKHLKVGDIIRISGTRDHGIRRVIQFKPCDGDLVLEQLKTPTFDKLANIQRYSRVPRRWSTISGVLRVSCNTIAAAITSGNASNITHAAVAINPRSEPDVVDIHFEPVIGEY